MNEYGSLPRWLRSLELQRRLPDEFVIVDGGSTDGTWELLADWSPGVTVVLDCLPGSTISEARNHAITLSTGEVVAITDAGTVADRFWLQRLLGAFDDPGVDVAAGFFLPLATTRWPVALAATTLPGANEVDAAGFLPSSRSVAVRSAWLEAGFLYPEWLDYCEDLVFNLRLKRSGAKFAFVPDAVVYFEPRRSLPAYFRQYYRYARGDGKAGLFPARHLVRYATYLGLLAVICRQRPREVFATTLLGAAYMRRPIARLRKLDSDERQSLPVLLALSSAQRLVGDLAKMTGYPVGLVWRWRRFGGLGWRTSWQRISPSGCLWRPPPAATGTPRPRASHGDESHPNGS